MEQTFYQFNTKNLSFMDMHKILVKERVTNNKFFLRLDNQDLADIDPHDPNLNKEQQAAVVKECMNNYWYFLREVVRLPSRTDDIIRFRLNIVTLSISYLLDKNICRIIGLNTRQMGEELSFICKMMYEDIFSPCNKAVIMSHKYEHAKMTRTKIIDFVHMLPEYIIAAGCTNIIQTVPTPKTLEAAECLTAPICSSNILYFKEATFIPYFDKLLESVLIYNHVIPFKGIYIKANIPRTINNSYLAIKKLIDQSTMFDLLFFDLSYKDLMIHMNMLSHNSFVTVSYSYNNVYQTEEWKRHQRLYLYNDPDIILRELELVMI